MHKLVATVITGLAAFSDNAWAADQDSLPLWEIGVGAAHFNLPQYIGSDDRTRGTLPTPYFVYRGKAVNISRDSVSGRLFKRADLVVDLSADISLPVDSEENDARTGMPDLDFLAEIGPAMRYILLRNTSEFRTISVELPLRAVFQSNLRYLSYEGWRLNPRFRYQEYFGAWHLSLWLGAYWNDRGYNELIYGVDDEYATEERSAYNASSGFGGWAGSFSMSYRSDSLWVGGFLRLYDIRSATFSDSPLVVNHNNIGFGLAAAWIFKTSSERVPRFE